MLRRVVEQDDAPRLYLARHPFRNIRGGQVFPVQAVPTGSSRKALETETPVVLGQSAPIGVFIPQIILLRISRVIKEKTVPFIGGRMDMRDIPPIVGINERYGFDMLLFYLSSEAADIPTVGILFEAILKHRWHLLLSGSAEDI